jgi:hypothetical protein
VTSEKTRKNLLNQADCLDRIRSFIREASKVPKELDSHELLQIEIRFVFCIFACLFKN